MPHKVNAKVIIHQIQTNPQLKEKVLHMINQVPYVPLQFVFLPFVFSAYANNKDISTTPKLINYVVQSKETVNTLIELLSIRIPKKTASIKEKRNIVKRRLRKLLIRSHPAPSAESSSYRNINNKNSATSKNTTFNIQNTRQIVEPMINDWYKY